MAQGFPGARGLAEIADLDQEFAVENRKACRTPVNAWDAGSRG